MPRIRADDLIEAADFLNEFAETTEIQGRQADAEVWADREAERIRKLAARLRAEGEQLAEREQFEA